MPQMIHYGIHFLDDWYSVHMCIRGYFWIADYESNLRFQKLIMADLRQRPKIQTLSDCAENVYIKVYRDVDYESGLRFLRLHIAVDGDQTLKKSSKFPVILYTKVFWVADYEFYI